LENNNFELNEMLKGIFIYNKVAFS